MKKKKKKQGKVWHDKTVGTYVGYDPNIDLIYVGGSYYERCAQIHLKKEEAKFIRKHLLKAINRAEK